MHKAYKRARTTSTRWLSFNPVLLLFKYSYDTFHTYCLHTLLHGIFFIIVHKKLIAVCNVCKETVLLHLTLSLVSDWRISSCTLIQILPLSYLYSLNMSSTLSLASVYLITVLYLQIRKPNSYHILSPTPTLSHPHLYCTYCTPSHLFSSSIPHNLTLSAISFILLLNILFLPLPPLRSLLT